MLRIEAEAPKHPRAGYAAEGLDLGEELKGRGQFCSAATPFSSKAGSYVTWFRGGLVYKAHRLLHHSILGVRVMKKKKKTLGEELEGRGQLCSGGTPLLVRL